MNLINNVSVYQNLMSVTHLPIESFLVIIWCTTHYEIPFKHSGAKSNFIGAQACNLVIYYITIVTPTQREQAEATNSTYLCMLLSEGVDPGAIVLNNSKLYCYRLKNAIKK